jgi:hypothetical protein
MWQNTPIGALFGDEKHIKYKVFFENLSKAHKQGMIVTSILDCTNNGMLPEWINNRIPQNESCKLDYLVKTGGRLETDDIWFQAA